MKKNTINQILQQKDLLCKKIPEIENFFINISLEKDLPACPFLPIRCFRDFDLYTGPSQYAAKFFSSGSTGNKPASHTFSADSLTHYSKTTSNEFNSFLSKHGLAKTTPVVSLIPTREFWPSSSLAAMVEMFKHNGFNIIYCNIDSNKNNFIDVMQKMKEDEDCIIFGTTFHHLSLVQNPDSDFQKKLSQLFSKLKISVIDTGGTKGRTQGFTLQESIQFFSKFYKAKEFSLYSEYGMCELASQAWSTRKIHDGTLTCNSTLTPVVLDAKLTRSLRDNETGFLAFIDTLNLDSYGAIITEDMAYKINENTFHLIGRGPDASVKGCSLNVKDFFNFESTQSKNKIVIKNPITTPVNLNELIAKLSMDDWDKNLLNDLKLTLKSIDAGIPMDTSFADKKMLIISAANTPIAWVFPYLIAANSQAQSITIKTPSLRLDDFFSNKVRNQTFQLISEFAQHFPMTTTYVDTSKSIAQTFHHYDFVLTFGTSETISTISKQINRSFTQFVGKGDIKNAIHLTPDNNSLVTALEACTLWNGRGCLTPAVIFLNGTEDLAQKWIVEFATELERQFIERAQLQNWSPLQKFSHAHNCFFVTSQLKSLQKKPMELLIKGERTCVVNLTQLNLTELQKLKPEFNFCGTGFVYVMNKETQHLYPELSHLSHLPSIANFEF